MHVGDALSRRLTFVEAEVESGDLKVGDEGEQFLHHPLPVTRQIQHGFNVTGRNDEVTIWDHFAFGASDRDQVGAQYFSDDLHLPVCGAERTVRLENHGYPFGDVS